MTETDQYTWPRISKPSSTKLGANLDHYDRRCAEFSWEAERQRLAGLPGGAGLNIAYEAVDRHADGPRARTTALRCIDRHEGVTDITYAELRYRSNRFANLLRGLGVSQGETVFTLLNRIPELYDAVLGAWKAGCIVAPLFAAFGPEPVLERMRLGDARVLVTTATLYRRKVEPVRRYLPGLRHVLIVGDSAPVDTTALDPMLQASATAFGAVPTKPEDPALLHFTSGTTGRPKGVVHVHDAVVAHHATAAYALDLREGDIYWCTADPGWVTGMSYGIIAPLTHGVTVVTDQGEFDAPRWYRILAGQRVTVWYTAPTALRMLMRHGTELLARHDLSALRFAASVGEPLNPEIVMWSQEAFGIPVHDNWWQTETGAIMLSNFQAEDIKPGSMGRPVPGIQVGLLERGSDGRARVHDGRVSEVSEPEVAGELAIRTGWPSMFRQYLNDPDRYASSFADGWYLTGDVARRDDEGYYWFVSRADDVIKSAGHLVGPFEVESALMAHPAVAEVGVIGKPDPVAGELVKAFVVLRSGYHGSEQLRDELLSFGRRLLGAVAPKEVAIVDAVPHTRSGKIMRRLLKARELGLDEGDTSTMDWHS
ncbi:acetate--CoA ligase [Haloechinothrix sp. LS1_15]|uniref:acetate--CoA ligase n=1 Tax=Haloechinothrix sp. LS1_15 TaxID=2652248 RepID=UPI00294AB222|nr:acetate--CoA ligase [Haloechinothrix sp. LS1_15]